MPVSPFAKPEIALDWRLTARCGAPCPVCPLIDPQSRDEEVRGELSPRKARRVLDIFLRWVADWEVQGSLRLWGGEFARCPDFFDLLEYARSKSLRVELVGCARNLEGIGEALKGAGVSLITFPLFGLGAAHDRFRSPGDFSATLRAHRALKAVGLETAFLFFWSREFHRELRDVLAWIEQERVASFSFLRHPYLGRDHPLAFGFSAGDFFSMMFDFFEGWMALPRSSLGPPAFLGREPLWSLFYQTWGMADERPEEKDILHKGCRAGCSTLGLRADGVVYPCLFLPLKIGEVPAQSLREIFVESGVLKELREGSSFVKCRDCDLARVCRGCPAMAHQGSGGYLNDDPHYWKNISERPADG